MKKSLYLAIVLVVIFTLILILTTRNEEDDSIKIGLITDLSGSAAYFGEKSLLGAEIVKKEFADKGIKVEIISEDYQLRADQAATAAHKLINVDGVDIIYTDFNPGAIATASVIEGKDVPFIYAAAIESPLKQSGYTLKTYLDYRMGCKEIANRFKNGGVEKMGVLKMEIEFGELCAEGVREVYGENIVIEGYKLGDVDFRTQLVKLGSEEVGAVINVGFEGDTYNTLKNMKELGLNFKYGTVEDTLTSKVLKDFSEQLEGGFAFGYEPISEDFKRKIESFTGEKYEDIGPEYIATALVYTHLTQAVEAIYDCENDIRCFAEEMENKNGPNILGFERFENRIAMNTLKLFEF